MTEEDLKDFLEANKREIQAQVKQRLIDGLLSSHQWTMRDQIGEVVGEFMKNEIMPEVRSYLVSETLTNGSPISSPPPSTASAEPNAPPEPLQGSQTMAISCAAVMKTAHNIYRVNRDHMSFSDALRMAWLTISKEAEYIVIVPTNEGWKLFAAMSSDGARRVQNEMARFFKDRGLHNFNPFTLRVAHYVASVEVRPAVETKAVRAREVRDVQQPVHGVAA